MKIANLVIFVGFRMKKIMKFQLGIDFDKHHHVKLLTYASEFNFEVVNLMVNL